GGPTGDSHSSEDRVELEALREAEHTDQAAIGICDIVERVAGSECPDSGGGGDKLLELLDCARYEQISGCEGVAAGPGGTGRFSPCRRDRGVRCGSAHEDFPAAAPLVSGTRSSS